jgi:hypothetical protein
VVVLGAAGALSEQTLVVAARVDAVVVVVVVDDVVVEVVAPHVEDEGAEKSKAVLTSVLLLPTLVSRSVAGGRGDEELEVGEEEEGVEEEEREEEEEEEEEDEGDAEDQPDERGSGPPPRDANTGFAKRRSRATEAPEGT